MTFRFGQTMPRVIQGLSKPIVQAAAALVTFGVLIWAAHGGALPGAFHYDDFYAFVQNPAVKTWHPLRYFTATDAGVAMFNTASYRPLTVWSFSATYRLAGMEPSSFLIVNMVLHGVASWLVFLIGRLVLGDARWAWLAGAVYAIHPINAEAVNYAVTRAALLSTVFGLASAWAFIRYAEHKGGRWLVLVGLAAFAGGLLSKESAVALVVPLLAYAWLRPTPAVEGGIGSRATRAAVVYAVLAALYVAFWTVVTSGVTNPPTPSVHPAWTFLEMLGRSLALWIWPWPLGLDHPLTFLSKFHDGLAVALVAGVVGLALAVIWLKSRAPVAAWGLVWAVAGLAPLAPLPWLTTIGLLQEQRMGFSAAGLSWTTAVLVRELWMAAGRQQAARWLRATIACAGVALAVVAVAIDRGRSAVWNDDRRLWAEVVERSPDNLLARINLGSAYMMHREYGRAKAVFEEILVLVPSYYRAHYNLGLLALRQNLTDEAAAAFQRAVHLNPQDADAQTNLGILALRAGDTRTAEAVFRIALDINPTQRDALNNLATIHLQRREFAVALDLVTAALRRDPEFLEASYNQGVALAGLGRHAEAATVLRDMRGRLPPDPAFDRYRTAIDHLLVGGAP